MVTILPCFSQPAVAIFHAVFIIVMVMLQKIPVDGYIIVFSAIFQLGSIWISPNFPWRLRKLESCKKCHPTYNFTFLYEKFPSDTLLETELLEKGALPSVSFRTEGSKRASNSVDTRMAKFILIPEMRKQGLSEAESPADPGAPRRCCPAVVHYCSPKESL